jgi:two-component system, NtrC family, sensor kinase
MRWRSIKTKLIVGMSLGVTVILLTVIYRATVQQHRFRLQELEKVVNVHLDDCVTQLEARINRAGEIGMTLVHTFAGVRDPNNPLAITRDQANIVLRSVLQESEALQTVFMIWESNAFDQMDVAYADADMDGHDHTGRFMPCWHKDSGGTLALEAAMSQRHQGMADHYEHVRQTGRSLVMDPVVNEGAHHDTARYVRVVLPIIHNTRFYGVVGVGVDVIGLQAVLDASTTDFPGARLFVTSREKAIIASSGGSTLQGHSLDVALHQDGCLEEEETVNSQGSHRLLTRCLPIDIGGETEPWVLSARVPTDIIMTQVNQQMLEQIAMGLLFMGITLVFIHYLATRITHPLRSLNAVIQNMVKTGNLDQEVDIRSKDEIGELADSFCRMIAVRRDMEEQLVTYHEDLEHKIKERTQALQQINSSLNQEIVERENAQSELIETQQQLLEASHRAGRAEVATNVLHNVGNILNSINVSATLIRETISESEINNLGKVVDMIKAHGDDLPSFLSHDPQGRHVIPYLDKVALRFVREQEDMTDRLLALTDDISHINEIIKTQQDFAKASGVEVSVSVGHLVDDALRINEDGLYQHHIRVIRRHANLGEINIDRQKVLQIIINLINNAKYALLDSPRTDKALTVQSERHGDDRLRISVTDNGVGISPDNLIQIFRHGFTTKKQGHGFGLHSAALAAQELGGSLSATSDGVGHGATFILELPLKSAGGVLFVVGQSQVEAEE